ncbi:hypothetical protein AOLI_G00061710 [Acnodon oligacanthus]
MFPLLSSETDESLSGRTKLCAVTALRDGDDALLGGHAERQRDGAVEGCLHSHFDVQHPLNRVVSAPVPAEPSCSSVCCVPRLTSLHQLFSVMSVEVSGVVWLFWIREIILDAISHK